MANDYREILETKRLEITERLNCERTYLLNYLRCKGVFDQEDCELILSEKTNKSRAGRFVDELLRKGPEGYQHFVDVIQVENSSLYEVLTGLMPTSNPSPLMKNITNPELNTGVCYFGLGMLADHQQRLYSELQEVHRQNSALVNAKQDLEGRLVRANKDLEFEKERRTEYEKTYTLDMAEDEEQFEDGEVLLHECDELQKGIGDRDVYIIVLQMKLLAEKEECDNLRSKMTELQHKTENMDRELRRISESYNHERSQSWKLSECIRIQGEDIQRMDVLKQRLRESQFQNILMRDERDCANGEMDELKQWAEALKTRFDVIEKEKYNYLEKSEFVTSNCANLQESVRMLQRKLSLSQLEMGELQKRNELLVKDSDIYKKQRDIALDARKESILERDKAVSERDYIQMQYSELQTKRDKMNEDRAQLIQDYDWLESRHTTTMEELSQLRRKLNEKELEVGDLMRNLTEVEEKAHRKSCLMNAPTAMASEKTDNDASPSETPHSPTAGPTENNEDKPNEEGTKSRWRDRKLKSLLNSMKLRISGVRSLDDIAKDPVSPASENMTLQVLQCLLPNLSSRPYSTVRRRTRGEGEGGGVSKSLSRTLERQLAIRRPIAVDQVEAGDPPKAFSLPNCKPKDSGICEDGDDEVVVDTRRFSKNPELAMSAPNLTALYSDGDDDVDTLPVNFRDRATLLVGKVRRSHSDLK